MIIIKFIMMILLTVVFFKYIKHALINCATFIAPLLPLKKKYPLSKLSNSIRLILISITTVGYMFFTLWITNTKWNQINMFKIQPILLLDGILLGLGIAGVSTLLCQLLMLGIQNKQVGSRFITTKSGLMHYFYDAKEIFPIYFYSIIIIFQAFSEEIIFRAAYLHYFSPAGKILSILLSTLLFICMESFFMPSKIQSLFPMLIAAMMG